MKNNAVLHLVIGEDIPSNMPNEFDKVKLYVRDKSGNLNSYAEISLPYLINYAEFLDIKDDPRYFFMEEYDFETKCCKYICEIKPLGMMKGIYRVLNGERLKIGNIEPLYEFEENMGDRKLLKKGGKF